MELSPGQMCKVLAGLAFTDFAIRDYAMICEIDAAEQKVVFQMTEGID